MEVLDMPHLHKYQNDIADEFFEALAETECIEVFSNKSVQALIEIKWPLVKAAIKKYLFIPYLFFIFAFLYYTVGVFEKFHEKEPEAEEGASTDPATADAVSLQSNLDNFKANMPDFNQLQDPKFWLEHEMIILKGIIQFFVLYFMAIELRQLYLAGFTKYLSSPWNYLDIIPLVLINISLFFQNLGFEP
jgi:hypothetical protein